MHARTIYLSIEEVLLAQSELINRYGGSHGLRDRGLLESALHRPSSGYYETLADQAAALFQSLTVNHCFVDGNKRIALAATALFLRYNGVRLRFSADDGESFIVERMITGRAEVPEIAAWLTPRMKRVGV